MPIINKTNNPSFKQCSDNSRNHVNRSSPKQARFALKPMALMIGALLAQHAYAAHNEIVQFQQLLQCEQQASTVQAKADCAKQSNSPQKLSEAQIAQLRADASFEASIASKERSRHMQLAEANRINALDFSPSPNSPSPNSQSPYLMHIADASDSNSNKPSEPANTNNKFNTPNKSLDSKTLNKKAGADLPLGTERKDSNGKVIDLQLKETTIRAKRFYQIGPLPGLGLTKEEIPGNVQSITAKEIKESRALSLTDLMNSKLQSVNVNDYQSNPFQMDVTYRGFTASPQIGTAQGLSVFLDGIRVNEPFGDVVNWDMIPLNALNGLDVFPGSNPIFGLGTLGGALSMRTKSGFDSNEGTVEALGGSFNRKQFQGSIGGNNGVIAGFVAANIFREDGWRNNSPSEVNQLFGKAEWRNENLQLGLSALYAGNKLVGNGLLPTELAKQDSSQIFTSPDETKNRLLQFQLSGLWDVSDTFNISAQVYKRKSRRNSSTGDVNQDFSGGATRRPNAGERVSSYVPDLNNDGLPDIDPALTNIVNIAQGAVSSPDGSIVQNVDFDANGNIKYLSIENDGSAYTDNPLFDANNLAVGTTANTALFANQATETFTAANGTTTTRPAWGSNSTPFATAPVFTPTFYQQALALFNARGQNSIRERLDAQLRVDGFNQNYAADSGGANFTFLDANGFLVAGATVSVEARDANGQFTLQTFSDSGPGLGKPAGLFALNTFGGQIQRNGADCDNGDPNTYGKCSGYVDGTPVALITETDIDQTTDGGAVQFNWNLQQHKFMLGMSIDAADASYKSGQYLGLLDNKRNAFRDPNQVGYEFAAASTKLGLNDFAGDSITKSLYFSETWTPKKEWAFTAAGRYNITHIKNELAINNVLGLTGPTAFKNFYEDLTLCKDANGNGTLEPDTECPLGEIRPFSLELAQGLGAIGKGEIEKFTYRSFNPSLGATWQPNDALNVYANWNKGARTPSVIELGCAFDDTPVQIGVHPTTGAPLFEPRSIAQRRFCSLPSTLAGDPYLKQVRSETLEVGARGYLTPDIQWNAAVYNTDLTDDIYFVSFRPERSFFTTIGNTRRRGVEMGLQGKVGKAGFRLNYSLTDATFQDSFNVASPHNSSAGNVVSRGGNGFQEIAVRPGNRMPGVPLHNLNATLTYDITQDWTVGLTGILHSTSFIRGNENNKHKANSPNNLYGCSTLATTTVIDGIAYGNDTCETKIERPGFRFPGKVPGYAVFNFNTSYKITKGLTAGLQISNLFDREYYSAGRLGINAFSPSINGAIGPGGFNYNSNDWLASTFLAPGAPRSAFFSLTYDFDPSGK